MTDKILPHEVGRLQAVPWRDKSMQGTLRFFMHGILGSDFGVYLISAEKYIGVMPLNKAGLDYIKDDAPAELLRNLPLRCFALECKVEGKEEISREEVAVMFRDIKLCADPKNPRGAWIIETLDKIHEVLNLPKIEIGF